MSWILLEAALALGVFGALVWWTVGGKRNPSKKGDPQDKSELK